MCVSMCMLRGDRTACKTIDILKLLDISLPSASIRLMKSLIDQLLHLLGFYIQYSLAQSKLYHQMICLY